MLGFEVEGFAIVIPNGVIWIVHVLKWIHLNVKPDRIADKVLQQGAGPYDARTDVPSFFLHFFHICNILSFNFL